MSLKNDLIHFCEFVAYNVVNLANAEAGLKKYHKVGV